MTRGVYTPETDDLGPPPSGDTPGQPTQWPTTAAYMIVKVGPVMRNVGPAWETPIEVLDDSEWAEARVAIYNESKSKRSVIDKLSTYEVRPIPFLSIKEENSDA